MKTTTQRLLEEHAQSSHRPVHGLPDRKFNAADPVDRTTDPGDIAWTLTPTAPVQRRWKYRPLRCWLAAVFIVAGPSLAASQPTPQSTSKLVGTGAVGPAEQGWSVALSADGKTAIVGGIVDNGLAGAAWVYTRSDGGWTQQGSKLVGTGVVGQGGQGVSVALSADGNTAIVGGPHDSATTGAAWVYTRSGGIWTQQGGKLVGIDAAGSAGQGVSVALSADGNTAIVGGPHDNSFTGAAWIFTRGGTVWTQQGSKLVGTGAVGIADQGWSVALSADGNTAIVGGYADNSFTGAVWVYARRGSVWAQQGSKLVGIGAVGNADQGRSVALSADGNTAVVGGPHDNAYTGAVWVYTLGGAAWTQQGNKLVAPGVVGSAMQGSSVAVSADGNTAIAGALADDRVTGAAWVHTRSGAVWTTVPAPSPGF